MDTVDLIGLLEQQLITHSLLKEQDALVVQRICAQLRIPDQGGVDPIIRDSVQLEAGCVYLTGKYQELADKLEEIAEDRKAKKYIELSASDEHDTKTERDYWIRTFDAEYRMSRTNAAKAAALLKQLKGLSLIVFDRMKKLEQLSINFRREMQADSNS